MQAPVGRTRKRQNNYAYSIIESLMYEIHRLYNLPHRYLIPVNKYVDLLLLFYFDSFNFFQKRIFDYKSAFIRT